MLSEDKVKEKDFDISNFLYVLRPYYRGGEFDYLLNADVNLDLLQQRFIVFELDNIKDHPILFPVVTIIIMEVFISKMRKLKGIHANEVMVVGDTPYDIEAAGKCGIAAIALRSGKFSDETLQRAGAIKIYDDVAALFTSYSESPLTR